MGSLRTAKVIKAHPEANAVDLVYTDDGSRVPMVQVMGHVDVADLPHPTPPDDPDKPLRRTGKRDVYAIVGDVGGIPIVLGFKKVQVQGNLFKGRENFRIQDHASGAYTTLDDAGNFTMHWPNGTAMVVGEDPTPEDLNGADFDGVRETTRNTDRSMHVRLVLKAGGDQKAVIHITPTGDATIQLDGDLNIQVAGSITSSAPDWNHTGDFNIDGNVTVDGDLDATGTITGDTDVIAGTKSGKTHTHPTAAVGPPSPPT